MGRGALLALLLLQALARCSANDGDETVEYLAADGSKQTMSKKEMAEQMRQQEEFLKDATKTDTGFSKEAKGTATMGEIEEDNPGLALFLKKGEVAFKLLKKAGHAASDSTLAHLTSTELDPEMEASEERKKNRGFVREGIILTVAGYDGETDARGEFEVVLERDMVALASPGIHLLKVWKLDGAGGRAEELYVELLPEATGFQAFVQQHSWHIQMILTMLASLITVHMLRLLFERFVLGKKPEGSETSTATAASGTSAEAAGKKESSKSRKKSARKRTKRD